MSKTWKTVPYHVLVWKALKRGFVKPRPYAKRYNTFYVAEFHQFTQEQEDERQEFISKLKAQRDRGERVFWLCYVDDDGNNVVNVCRYSYSSSSGFSGNQFDPDYVTFDGKDTRNGLPYFETGDVRRYLGAEGRIHPFSYEHKWDDSKVKESRTKRRMSYRKLMREYNTNGTIDNDDVI